MLSNNKLPFSSKALTEIKYSFALSSLSILYWVDSIFSATTLPFTKTEYKDACSGLSHFIEMLLSVCPVTLNDDSKLILLVFSSVKLVVTVSLDNEPVA